MTSFQEAMASALAKAAADTIAEFASRQYFFPDEMEAWSFFEAIRNPNGLWGRCAAAAKLSAERYKTVGELRLGLLTGDFGIESNNFGKKSKKWLFEQVMRK